jgi:hypothetical protein
VHSCDGEKEGNGKEVEWYVLDCFLQDVCVERHCDADLRRSQSP